MYSRRKNTFTKSLPLLFLLGAVVLGSGIRFDSPDLSGDDIVLLEAVADGPGSHDFRVLLSGHVESNSLRSVTWYPEEWSWFPSTGVLQLRNRFGLFRAGGDLRRFSSFSDFSPFRKGESVKTGKLLPVSNSPDGRYIAWFHPLSAAYGEIILTDTERGVQQAVTGPTELKLKAGPVIWSPDSSLFVWEEEGLLRYRYVDPSAPVGEGLLGRGRLEGACFNTDGEFWYPDGRDLHVIKASDFPLRNLYRDIPLFNMPHSLLPLAFDPEFDRWWLSPDSRTILLYKGDGGLFLFPVDGMADTPEATATYPSLVMGSRLTVRQVLFVSDSRLLILLGKVTGLPNDTILIEWTVGENRFRTLNEAGLTGMALCPEDGHLVFFDTSRVVVRDAGNATVRDLFVPGLIGGEFIEKNKLLLFTDREALTLDTDTGDTRFLFLTQPGEASGFNSRNGIQTIHGDRPYSFDSETGTWEPGGDALLREKKLYSEKYRIFLDPLVDHPWNARLMVRKVSPDRYGTVPLFPVPEGKYEPFPETEEGDPIRSGIYFRHGSRIRRREVSLAFNVEKDVSGLPGILETLNDYGFKCTFFISGDVIRRYPETVRTLAASGHETGSLFYTGMDLSDNRYLTDTRFIIEGLADNEDRYFELTGLELAPLWHAPWYIVNRNVLLATREMNYTCIGRDITEELSPSAAIRTEKILDQKKPGSIIPIPVGHPSGDNGTTVPRLEFLIQGLLEEGYAVVPVSVLMEHSK